MGLLHETGRSTQVIVAAAIGGPIVGKEELAAAVGYIENAGAPTSIVPKFIGEWLFDTTNHVFYRAYGVSSGNWTALVRSVVLTQAAYDALSPPVAGVIYFIVG